ncbi:MAG: hypothetical protein E6Q56_10515 [Mycobacterium sp.]|nr:MAG: hypothetical protein E6Q56_10515 [Mycobacterium sp.]
MGAATQQLRTTTTATTRDAAQVDCAAFGERLLKAGMHVVMLTRWWPIRPIVARRLRAGRLP